MSAPEKNTTVVSTEIKPNDILALITGEMSLVRETIQAQLVSDYESINSLLKTITAAQGKMLRPALVLLTAKCVGSITPTHIKIAAVIEMIHNATLLHDDVIDEADIRRNSATANALWGNESAVLLGDFLLGKVFEISADIDSQPIHKKLAETTTCICRGELMQNLNRGNFNLTEPEYTRIVKDKTAAIFSCACHISALAANATAHQIQSLSDFGINLGLAFQITDDVLDIIGDEKKMGKTLGTDFDKCTLTLPLIHFLSNASNKDRKTLIEKIEDASDPQAITEMLKNSASIQYATDTAKRYCTQAIDALTPLPQSKTKDTLINIAASVTKRNV